MSCQHTSMDGGKCVDCDYCLHEVIYFNLCAVCGQSVDSTEGTNSKDHIDINHKSTGIKVSKKEAERLEKEDEKRLLREKKLSLIIDLDQTILHAAWEPHIAKWVDEHKNDKRAREMNTFSLDGSINKYTIKLRPGLREFLNEISKYYEMHIYTMGTRAYADAVAKVIDPNGNLFHDRILSRDENGSMTKKRLERLFPSDQTKVIILDDRADVWDYSPNLIQMRPYEYFAGIGDINAPPVDKINQAAATPADKGESSSSDPSETTESVESTDTDDSVNKEETPDEEPDQALNNTMPANQQQQQTFSSDFATNPTYTPKSHDSDNILPIIKDVLIQVHDQFYNEIDNKTTEKPNVAHIMSSLKSRILEDSYIVFSGVIPLQCRPEDSSIWKMATAFGAKCMTELTGKVTHLVAATVGTSKVNTARKYESIKIVSPNWLTNSVWEWKKQSETDYLMTVPREGSIASEVENPEESSLDFEDDKLDIDWDDSEVDAVLDDDEDGEDEDPGSSVRIPGEEAEEEEEDEEEEEEDDWLLGQLEDDDEGEIQGYGEEDDDDDDEDEEVSMNEGRKRKRGSDEDNDEDS